MSEPMTQDEIAACKARCEAAWLSFNENYERRRTPGMSAFEEMKQVLVHDIPRLLATVEARDELLRQAEDLLEECTEFVEGEGFAGRVLAIRAFLGAKEG